MTKRRYKLMRGRVAERARDLMRQSCHARDVAIVRRGDLAAPPPHAAVAATAGSSGEFCAVLYRGGGVAAVARKIP